jgi:hypothetical protein
MYGCDLAGALLGLEATLQARDLGFPSCAQGCLHAYFCAECVSHACGLPAWDSSQALHAMLTPALRRLLHPTLASGGFGMRK